MRYRLDVVGTSVADVVQNAGGWLFDRAVAGWDVTVMVPRAEDTRPLQILGAEMLDLESVLAGGGRGRRPQALAVAANICEVDSRARSGLLKALGHGGIEVVVWGEGWPLGSDHGVDPVLHRLSLAAQAFKAHALAAGAVPTSGVGSTELFRSGVLDHPPVGADLSPVG